MMNICNLANLTGSRWALGSRFAPFTNATVQWDATVARSAVGATTAKCVITGNEWLGNVGVGSTTLVSGGTVDGYWNFGGTALMRAPSNYSVLADLHKTNAGNSYTLVLVGETTATSNDFLMGTANSPPLDGWALNYRTDKFLEPNQWGTTTFAKYTSTVSLTASTRFLLIYSYSKDANQNRIWMNGYGVTQSTFNHDAITTAADGNFAVGGLSNLGMYVGKIKSFMAMPGYCDDNLAADIINYYSALHVYNYAPIEVGFTGQSNADFMFTQFSGAGDTKFKTDLGTLTSRTVNSHNGATGGVALLGVNDSNVGTFLRDERGRCGTFDGVNDFAVSAANVGVFGSAARSMTFRANLASTGDQSLVSYGGSAGSDQFTATIFGGNYYFNGFGAGDWATGIAASTGWKTHILTYDGTTVRWYVDGTELGSGAARALNTTNGLLYIGTRTAPVSVGFYSSAQICDVRVYNFVLSANERTHVNTAGVSGTAPANPVLHYPMSERNGTTLYNVVANTNHATVNNATTTALAGFWANSQSVYSYNTGRGIRYSGVTYIPALLSGASAADGNALTYAAGDLRGPAYSKLATALTTAGKGKKALSWMVVDQGETDSSAFGASDTEANYTDYKAALATWRGYMKADYPNVKFLWIPTGKQSNSNNGGGYRNVRRAQLDFINELGDVHMGVTRGYLTMADNTHHDQVGYETNGTNIARRIHGIMTNAETGTKGPQITNAEFIDGTNQIVLTITPDGSDNVTVQPAFEVGYWATKINGSVAVASNAILSADNEITLTAASTMNDGDVVYVFHQNGPMKDAEPTSADATQKHWIDNGTPPLPLSPTYIQAQKKTPDLGLTFPVNITGNKQYFDFRRPENYTFAGGNSIDSATPVLASPAAVSFVYSGGSAAEHDPINLGMVALDPDCSLFSDGEIWNTLARSVAMVVDVPASFTSGTIFSVIGAPSDAGLKFINNTTNFDIVWDVNQAGTRVTIKSAAAFGRYIIIMNVTDASTAVFHVNSTSSVSSFNPNDTVTNHNYIELFNSSIINAATNVLFKEMLIADKVLSAADISYVHSVWGARYTISVS